MVICVRYLLTRIVLKIINFEIKGKILFFVLLALIKSFDENRFWTKKISMIKWIQTNKVTTSDSQIWKKKYAYSILAYVEISSKLVHKWILERT